MSDVFNQAFPASTDYPIADDVRLDVVYNFGALTGTVREAIEANVLLGYQYGANDSLTGLLSLAAGNPDDNDVRDGVVYGSAAQFTGNLVVPIEGDVRDGIQYDSNGSRTGTLAVAGGSLPDVEDVRFGVSFNNGADTGVLELPGTEQVLIGIGYGAYGTEFEGTLTEVSGGTTTPMPPVLGSGMLRSPLVIGSSYTGALAFRWDIPVISGVTEPSPVTLEFGLCGCVTDLTLNGTVAVDPGDAKIWNIVVEGTSAETLLAQMGENWWQLSIVDGTETYTIEQGTVVWVC